MSVRVLVYSWVSIPTWNISLFVLNLTTHHLIVDRRAKVLLVNSWRSAAVFVTVARAQADWQVTGGTQAAIKAGSQHFSGPHHVLV